MLAAYQLDPLGNIDFINGPLDIVNGPQLDVLNGPSVDFYGPTEGAIEFQGLEMEFGADSPQTLTIGTDVVCAANNVCTPKTDAAKQQIMALQSAIIAAARVVGYPTKMGDPDGIIGSQTLTTAVMVAKAAGDDPTLQTLATQTDLMNAASVATLAQVLATQPLAYRDTFNAFVARAAGAQAEGAAAKAARKKKMLLIAGAAALLLVGGTVGYVVYRRRQPAQLAPAYY